MKKGFLLLMIVFILSIYLSLKKKIMTVPTSSYSNYIIFIDPGHGGKDDGTHYEDIFEDEINLKLSKVLFEMIINEGTTCYLSRVNDYDLSSTYSKNHKLEDLKKRVQYIDKMNTSIFVSLHMNYFHNTNVNGMQVFYQKNNEKSHQAAQIMQNKLNCENSKEKQCKVGDYFILNNTKSPGILIEYGFLSNEYDRKKILKDSYLIYLAKIIYEGIIEYLNQNNP